MLFAHRASKLMLDTSPVRRFAEAGLIHEMQAFLGEKAYAPSPVLQELRDISDKFKDIDAVLKAKWPKPAPQVEQRVLDDIFRLQKRYRPPARSDDPRVNLGEIAAVQMAIHLGFPLLVADDELAAKLSRLKLGRISTAMLAAEMVALGHLDENQGWNVWDSATPDDADHDDYERAASRARLDLALDIYT